MNWKNVVRLMRVDMKSDRLVRGRRLTRYRGSKAFAYLLYGGALALGLAAGTAAGLFYGSLTGTDPQAVALFDQALSSLFLTLPTLVLVYNLVFTMMQQIQRSGAKFSVQAPYWLPITWEEHTLASVLANLVGIPLVSIIFIGSAIAAVSVFTGQVAFAALTLLTLLASALMASATTEILRILQVRFIGAVYKSSGRAAVWVRFAGSLLFFLAFYIFYFFVTSGEGTVAIVQAVASGQIAAWFVPFLWLGMALHYFANGLVLQELAFMALSLSFIFGLLYIAVALNKRYGLYEPPAITVSRGAYTPRTGLLGRLGFSTVEAALIRKDLRAFTRRRELMYVFILPIVLVIVTMIQTGASSRYTPAGSIPSLAMVFLVPSAVIVLLGSMMIGEEGGAMWRIYSSPVSAESLVKGKYAFMLFFSIPVVAITGTVGSAVFQPSPKAVIVAFAESLLLASSLGAVSLANGVKGADFTEFPRPRMIRFKWAIINMMTCFVAALAILAPFAAYALALFQFVSLRLVVDPYQATMISGAVATAVTFAAYRLAIKNAKELLAKAEN